MRIALIDPSKTTRLIVSRMLEARGHEVVPFADEREALRQIKIDLRIDAAIGRAMSALRGWRSTRNSARRTPSRSAACR
jgi:CheY-like chemotaxis protein